MFTIKLTEMELAALLEALYLTRELDKRAGDISGAMTRLIDNVIEQTSDNWL
jgi:hypothetical protein